MDQQPAVTVRRQGVAMAVLGALALGAARVGSGSAHGDIAGAAQAFLDSFEPGARGEVVRPFDAEVRKDWHYVPRDAPGVTFARMNDVQRARARALVRSALSAQGMLKVESIITLEGVLGELERAAGEGGANRDPLRYSVVVYGDPKLPPWGWKIEGHHVSLNFTISGDGGVASTPSFLGANPGEVRRGATAGSRVLAMEEDLARELVLSLDDRARAEALISADAPAGILTSPGRELGVAAAEGVSYAQMTESQRLLLDRLLREYAANLRHELADAELARIRSAGLDKVRFAWAGSTERGKGHYYRITGPTFVIEYDNTQNGANHIHTVWHDRERDFGGSLLREHLRRDHSHGQ